MDVSEPREITESYRLERVVKSSRVGIVLRASDPATGATVAIKLIPPTATAELQACRQRFLRAMEALTALRTPAFPALRDCGFTPDGSAFMVMEYVDGTPLAALAGSPADRILRLILATVDGLSALAGAGIAHGNIAPDNLLAVAGEGGEGVRILGFGTAAFRSGFERSAGVAAAGEARGFSAPEQHDWDAAAHELTSSSDMYSLALTACALLRAEVSLPDGPEPVVSLPASLRAGLGDAETLRTTLEQCLRRNPAERPASWKEFRRLLERAVTGTADAAASAVESAALIESGDLEIEGPPPFLSEPPALVAPPAATAAGSEVAPPAPGQEKRLEDTNPVPMQRVLELASDGGPAPPADEPHPLLATPAEAGETSGETVPVPAVGYETRIVDRVMPVAPSVGAEPAQGVEPAPVPPDTAGEPAAGGGQETAGQPAEPAPAPPTQGSPQQARAGGAKPAKGKRARAGAPRRRVLLLLLSGAAAVVLLAAAGAVLWWLQQRPSQAPAHLAPPPTRVPATPTAVPQGVAPARAVLQMQAAEHALTAGDWTAAGEALDMIGSADQALLSARELERLGNLRESTDRLRRNSMAKSIRSALHSGNVKLLRDSLKALNHEDEVELARDTDINQTLEEARRVLNLQNLMLKAQQDANWSQVLESASTLLTIIPRYGQAAELREKAAVALEREADGLAQKGQFDQASARLETLARLWPERPWLDKRRERIETERGSDTKLAALFATAEQSERDKVPERGLEQLASVAPNPHWEQRFRQLHARLEKQLNELDVAPPAVELAKDSKLEYPKGKPATINLHITDDHAVKGAKLLARIEGSDRYVELPVRHAPGGDWTAEISLAFHQNNTVEFYIVASDYSNHTGQLGSAKEPLKLKRKKWSLFGK